VLYEKKIDLQSSLIFYIRCWRLAAYALVLLVNLFKNLANKSRVKPAMIPKAAKEPKLFAHWNKGLISVFCLGEIGAV